MSNVVRKFDNIAATRPALSAWMTEADRLCWSDCFQAQRVAGELVAACVENRSVVETMSLAYRRATLADAEGEIAKARVIASFILDPAKRALARKAVNKLALSVRRERGV